MHLTKEHDAGRTGAARREAFRIPQPALHPLHVRPNRDLGTGVCPIKARGTGWSFAPLPPARTTSPLESLTALPLVARTGPGRT